MVRFDLWRKPRIPYFIVIIKLWWPALVAIDSVVSLTLGTPSLFVDLHVKSTVISRNVNVISDSPFLVQLRYAAICLLGLVMWLPPYLSYFVCILLGQSYGSNVRLLELCCNIWDCSCFHLIVAPLLVDRCHLRYCKLILIAYQAVSCASTYERQASSGIRCRSTFTHSTPQENRYHGNKYGAVKPTRALFWLLSIVPSVSSNVRHLSEVTVLHGNTTCMYLKRPNSQIDQKAPRMFEIFKPYISNCRTKVSLVYPQLQGEHLEASRAKWGATFPGSRRS